MELTGQQGLLAIDRAGGPDEARYVLKDGYSYAPSKGARIAETYRQLAAGPMTGEQLLADLLGRNWLLPQSKRPYTRSQFRAHLKYMVGKGRLHVLTSDGASVNVGDFGAPPGTSVGGRGGGGEGVEHRTLKELIAKQPELVGLPAESKAFVEHLFLSGDRVDVMFKLPNGGAAVAEVETVVPLPGCHQAVKYRALLEVERLEPLGSGHVEAILVAHAFDRETRELAQKYKVRLVELKA